MKTQEQKDTMLDGSDMGLELWSAANRSSTQGGTGLNDQAISSLSEMQKMVENYRLPQPDPYITPEMSAAHVGVSSSSKSVCQELEL